MANEIQVFKPDHIVSGWRRQDFITYELYFIQEVEVGRGMKVITASVAQMCIL